VLYLGIADRATLYELLHQIDLDLAAQVRRSRCPYCGGPLCRAAYARKPRGGPDDLPDDLCVREGLCCAREGCRRRTLPPSTLFLGRKVYWAGVIVLAMTLRQRRVDGASSRGLQQRFGVSRNTVARWVSWFAEVFPTTARWKRIRGKVNPVVRNDGLPDSLVRLCESTADDPETALVTCLKLLAA
jgi:hypothetical protein